MQITIMYTKLQIKKQSIQIHLQEQYLIKN